MRLVSRDRHLGHVVQKPYFSILLILFLVFWKLCKKWISGKFLTIIFKGISHNFKPFMFFVQTQKNQASFVKYCENNAKNIAFLVIYIEIFKIFSKIFSKFHTVCVFRPNAKNSYAWFVKFFGKSAKIIMPIFLRIFSTVSKIFTEFPINILVQTQHKINFIWKMQN